MTRWSPLVAVLLLLAGTPAAADERGSAAERLQRSQAALEQSSAAVQSAGVALTRTAAALPAAQRAADLARGELAGAQALLAAAQREVGVGEVALGSAQRQVDAATAQVEATRAQVGRLARHSYQSGALAQVQLVTGSGPDTFVERTTLLRAAFRGGDDALRQLDTDRFRLAEQRATLKAVQERLAAARDEAAAQTARAQQLADQADAAAARVRSLVAERARALATARSARAADLADYQAAQAASRELARRLRDEARRRSTGVAQAGRMLWPADGPLTSEYGWRTHPIYGDRRFHAGIDIGAGYGSSVVAAADGVVVYAGSAQGYGTLVLISHGSRNGKDLATGYAHMSALLVSEGQKVSRGDQVGRVGNEGNSTGPHLHFEVRLDGDPVDPLGYVSPP